MIAQESRLTVGGYKQKTCLSRHDSLLLHRLRIGHIRLTHSFLLSGDDIPQYLNVNVYVNLYSISSQKAPLMRWMCRVLIKKTRLQYTTKTVNLHVRLTQIVLNVTCQCPLTVKHILVECVDLKDVRNKHFVASSIKDVFDNVKAQKIIDFIKVTRFYKQLWCFYISVYLLFNLASQRWSYIHRFYRLISYFHILSIVKTVNGTK